MSAGKQSVETPLQSIGPVPSDGVLQALERILVSERFIASPRSCHFLRFIIENTLAGRATELKESVIGLEVFERGSSFDPRNDSVVRVEARRLRAKLADYYRLHGADDAVVIDLPKGGYVPQFRYASQAPGPRPRGRSRFLISIPVAIVLLLTGAAWWVFRHPKQEPSANLEASELYGRGRFMSQQRGDEHLAQSIVLFSQAIQRDPQFAAAHAALAETSATLAFRQGTAASASSLQERAREEARTALKLDPGRSEAWGTLGALAAFHDWDWKTAEAAFAKGLKLNPRDAGVHRWYALGLLSQGRFDQAHEHVRHAYSSSPTSFALEIDLGRIHCAAAALSGMRAAGESRCFG